MITRDTLPESWDKIPVGAEISKELYWDRLDIMPPIELRNSPYVGFQVGEPYDHRMDDNGRLRPVFSTYIAVDGRYFYAGEHFAGECPKIKLEGDADYGQD